MAESSLTTRDLTVADLDAALDIQSQSFGRMADSWVATWKRWKAAAISPTAADPATMRSSTPRSP